MPILTISKLTIGFKIGLGDFNMFYTDKMFNFRKKYYIIYGFKDK